MNCPPDRPKLYHITHVENLPSILQCGCVWSHTEADRRALRVTTIGLRELKRRRLDLAVKCHPATTVGDYVPFYFGPRSVMLFVLHRGNHPGLDYREGQRPIVHLQADLRAVVAWAEAEGLPWAFTTRNATAAYADFHRSLADLNRIDWSAVRARDFRDPTVKENKQAEFLVYGHLPWRLVEKVGVIDREMRQRVLQHLASSDHRPEVSVEAMWYY